MSSDTALLFSFACVFVRCSAMLLTSPLFGAQTTPLQVRVLSTLAISGALTVVLQPHIGPAPADLYGLGAATLQEAVAGILLGSFVNLALQAAQIAGSLMDTQVGMGMSQVLNPINGVPGGAIAQFKFMLATVVFLCVDGHHQMLAAFARSYTLAPTLSASVIAGSFVSMLGSMCLLAVQIAAPVLGASLVVDAALGLINRAVPQMPAMLVGLPAKTAIGLAAVGLVVPAIAGGVTTGLQLAFDNLAPIFASR
ncbi:MAG: flagellar biosynthetic protein FliR [Fimbriimonas ginsengisoli]|uniref:Flagellar biosynthetic protein FliR n=1 Tax=Fimbriimonas ginsengisoli TaxID=1005039 RepID=A0A931LVY3_FIMGI|nr:flagellar biosynthetic protein FliR [Fimbriimonas ginsengisoli]